jgi:hypothetical protein
MGDNNNNKQISDMVVLREKPSQQLAVRVNRWLLGGVFFLMLSVFVLGFLLLPNSDFLSNYKQATATAVEAHAAETNPALSAEVNHLKSQFISLISGSIESKLRTLEDSLRSGAVTNSLGAIEDIKNDVKVLRAYSGPLKTEPAVDSTALMQEMSQLKRLIYLSLGSCGLMLAAAAGVWLKNIKALPSKASIIRYLSKQ